MIKDKITEFFVSIDDFCIDFKLEIQNTSSNRQLKRQEKEMLPSLIPRS